MGMLYYQCTKCSGSVGIQGQFIGFLKCLICNKVISWDVDHKFQRRQYECEKCGFKIYFESMNCSNVSCMKCNEIMKELMEVKKKR